MVDFNLLKPTPDFYGNAMNAFEAGRQTVGKRQASAALQSGDYGGATNALFGAGMMDQGLELQGQQRQYARQDQQDARLVQQDARRAVVDQREDMDFYRGELLRQAQKLRTMGDGQRPEFYRAEAVPLLLKLGIPQAEISRVLEDELLTDKELDGFIAQMGGEAPKNQGVNLGGGGFAEYDPRTGGFKILHEPTAQKAPAGYAWGPDGELAYIPGGPADPRQAGSVAAARRKPSGGGSGGAGGASASSYSPNQIKWD